MSQRQNDRHRVRQTPRQKETERDREREKGRERQRERETETERDREREIHAHRDKREAGRHASKQTSPKRGRLIQHRLPYLSDHIQHSGCGMLQATESC